MKTPMWRRIQRFLGADISADVDEELRHHLEMRALDLQRAGMPAEQARAEALRRFGDLAAIQAEVESIERVAERRERRSESFGDLAADFGYGVRLLRRNPAFTVAAVGTLAVTLGANAAVFSAVNSVLLRPLPFPEPDQLVMLWEQNPERNWYMQSAAPANVLDWRDRAPAFEDIAGFADWTDRLTVVGAGEPVALNAKSVTGNFFSVLGVTAAAGRLLTEEETWSNTEAAAVLSHDTWIRVFGGDAAAIGQLVRLNGVPYRIIGVAPSSFRLPGVEADLWRTLRWEPEIVSEVSFRRAHYLRPIGRVRPGIDLDEARAQLESVALALESEYPATNRLMGVGLTPLREFLVGDTATVLKVLLGSVLILLLLACANVGNLLLVRSLGRRKEIAVRGALGAGRSRLLRQAVVEGLVLSGVGGAAGLVLAWAAIRSLGAFDLGPVLNELEFALDARFALYFGGTLLLAVLTFSVAPALMSARIPPGEALKDDGRSAGANRRTRRVAAALVAFEVATSTLLLAGAILLVRSFSALQRVDPGFDGQGVLSAGLNVPAGNYDTDQEVVLFYGQLLSEIESLPGVERAALVRQLPLTAPSWTSDFFIQGREPDEYGVEVVHREVSPGYFETMRVPLLTGRTFSGADRAETERVIVVNEELARRYFPEGNAIGQRIAFSRAPAEDAVWWTVVGVVGSEIQGSPTDGRRIEIFAPLAQATTRGVNLVVRSSTDPLALAGPIAATLERLDREMVLLDVRTLDDVRNEATARHRFIAVLLGSFAGVALLLALVGVHGVMAQSIRSRRRELGIRAALGAKQPELVKMVTFQTARLLTAGVLAGLAGAFLASRAVVSLAYGVGPRDPVTLAIAAATLLVAGLAAAAVPVIRAGKIPPSIVLRE